MDPVNRHFANSMRNLRPARFEGAGRLISFGTLVTSLLLSLIGGISRSYGSETVIVNKSFHNREIKVRIGATIRVDLEELGSAGYVRMIPNLDRDHFEVLSVRTEATPSPGDFTGAPVIKTWLIRAKREGKAELKFPHYRPWEDASSASDTFVLKVRIIP